MQLQNIIVMMGPPGSGKGTQSKLLASKLGYAYFSMGDTFRGLAKQDTSLAHEIKAIIEQGIIVPDEKTEQVFRQAIEKVTDKTGLVIDGFPRTLGQIEMLNRFLSDHNISALKVFFLVVDKQKLLKRLSLRKTCPNCQAIYLPGVPEYITEICKVCGHKLEIRKDDLDIAAVEKRFDEYMVKTADVKEYYESQGLLTHINGDHSENAEESIKGVHEEILNKLGLQ